MAAIDSHSGFRGLRILVLEDDVLLAMELEDFLHDLGCRVVGPFNRVREAETAACDERLDGAILDINIRGELSFPVIDCLKQHGVPLILCSGYADLPNMREQLQGLPTVSKPCNYDTLTEMMRMHFLPEAAAMAASGR